MKELKDEATSVQNRRGERGVDEKERTLFYVSGRSLSQWVFYLHATKCTTSFWRVHQTCSEWRITMNLVSVYIYLADDGEV